MIDGLLEFVGHELKLNEKQSDGATLREHLQSVQRQSGIEDLLLRAVECSEQSKYIYEDYFLSMNRRRTSNGHTPNAISNTEMQAWARARGIALAPFESEALDRLETLYLEHCYKNIARATQT